MIAAFYSQATGWVHQVGVLAAHETLRQPLAGEGVMEIPDATFKQFMAAWQGGGDIDPLQSYVNQQRGVQPVNADYAMVLGSNVVNVVGRADPALGHLVGALAEFPGCVAVPTQGLPVAIGAIFNAATGFTNPVQQVLKGASQSLGS